MRVAKPPPARRARGVRAVLPARSSRTSCARSSGSPTRWASAATPTSRSPRSSELATSCRRGPSGRRPAGRPRARAAGRGQQGAARGARGRARTTCAGGCAGGAGAAVKPRKVKHLDPAGSLGDNARRIIARPRSGGARFAAGRRTRRGQGAARPADRRQAPALPARDDRAGRRRRRRRSSSSRGSRTCWATSTTATSSCPRVAALSPSWRRRARGAAGACGRRRSATAPSRAAFERLPAAGRELEAAPSTAAFTRPQGRRLRHEGSVVSCEDRSALVRRRRMMRARGQGDPSRTRPNLEEDPSSTSTGS